MSQISSLTLNSSTGIRCVRKAALWFWEMRVRGMNVGLFLGWVCGVNKPDGGICVVNELALDETQHNARLACAHLAEQHDLQTALTEALGQTVLRSVWLRNHNGAPGPSSGILCALGTPTSHHVPLQKEKRGKRKEKKGSRHSKHGKGKEKKKGTCEDFRENAKGREMKKRKAVVVQMSVGERERMVEEDRTKTQENVQSGSVQKTRSATRQRLSLFAPTHQRERKEY